MVGRILGYGRLFSLDQILEISTDLCHFPKKWRRFPISAFKTSDKNVSINLGY